MTMRDKIAERLVQHYAEGGPWDGYMEVDIVLEMILEADEHMIEAGSDARQPGNSRWGNTTKTWQAMIRAALEDK